MVRREESTIVELERAALDRWGKGDPSGYTDRYASDVSYFDPLTAARVDGRETMIAYYAPWVGKIRVPRYEMLNPAVVVEGAMALLTYNLVNYARTADGAEALGSSWNCTEVYRRRGVRWEIVHSHWSYTRHEAFRDITPEQTETASGAAREARERQAPGNSLARGPQAAVRASAMARRRYSSAAAAASATTSRTAAVSVARSSAPMTSGGIK